MAHQKIQTMRRIPMTKHNQTFLFLTPEKIAIATLLFLLTILLPACGQSADKDPRQGEKKISMADQREIPAAAQPLSSLENERITPAEQLKTALEQDPENPDLWNALGLMFVQQGNSEAAMNSFTTAVRLEPEHVEAHYHLANLAIQAHELQTAVNLYQRVLSLQPDHQEAREKLDAIAASLANTTTDETTSQN